MTFGGHSNEFSSSVDDRLLDTVERHIGIIGTGAGTYDQQSFQQTGFGMQYDDVYEFSENGDGDGSIGNPASLTQDTLDQINTESPEGAHIYIQGGSNANYNTTGLTVYDGQDFYGRTEDYTAPVPSNEQPHIQVADDANGFTIQDNQENTFSDLSIFSSGTGNNIGIVVNNTSGNTTELNLINTNITQFSTGVYASNSGSGNLIINTNYAHFNDNTSNTNAYGMYIVNSGSGNVIVNALYSQFNNNNVSGSDAYQAAGFYGDNSSTGNLTLNATVNAHYSTFNSNSVIANGSPTSYGLYLQNNGLGNLTLNAYLSEFDNNTTQGNNAQAFGVMAVNMNAGDLSIDASYSEFNNNTAMGSNNYAFGMSAYNTSSGDINIEATHSQFDNNTGTGLYVSNMSSGTLAITDLSDSSFYHNRDYDIYKKP